MINQHTQIISKKKKSKIDPTAINTHTFKFDDIEKAFDMMDKKEVGIIKPLIEFN